MAPPNAFKLEYTLHGAVVHLTAAASNPLEFISSAYKNSVLHLDMATEVDVTKTILSRATAQSRILGHSNDIVNTPFLPAIEDPFLNVASLCPVQATEDHAKLANMCAIGFKGTPARALKIVKHNPEDLQRAIAFVMSLVGNFVKSFASGNRRRLSNNTLREMLTSRALHKRRLGHRFDAFIASSTLLSAMLMVNELVSADEHNGFAMSMELIRLDVAADDLSRRTGRKETVQHIAEQLIGGVAEEESVASVTSVDEEPVKVQWPSVLSWKELANVVAETAHRSFDEHPSILLCVASHVKKSAEDDLAFYDSTSKNRHDGRVLSERVRRRCPLTCGKRTQINTWSMQMLSWEGLKRLKRSCMLQGDVC